LHRGSKIINGRECNILRRDGEVGTFDNRARRQRLRVEFHSKALNPIVKLSQFQRCKGALLQECAGIVGIEGIVGAQG
jgi:hypothetical protein